MNYQLTIDDYIGRWGYSKQYVRRVLSEHKGKHIDVRISSLGGDLDHGLDIRQQFIDHGDVTVYISGFTASSATVIAMGAKRIVMSKYAMFLVHKCSNFIDAWGAYNADQMQTLIDQLEENKKENDKIDVILANMYANRCGKKVSDMLDILKKGRWLTAQEALDWGFIDEISEEGAKLDFTPELEAKFNAFGISTVGLTVAENEAQEQPESKGLLRRLVDSVFHRDNEADPVTQEDNSEQNQSPKTMSKFCFTALMSFLGLTDLVADKDNEVTLKAEDVEKVSNHIDKLTGDLKTANDKVTEQATKIAELEKQVENLKKAPGDETNEIEDNEGEEAPKSSDMYNAIKDLL